jgi:nitrogen fixation/metabolism regulation signal transduction histidine kinase
MRLRHERILALLEGSIKFEMTHEPSEQGGKLTLQVTDSGKGFVNSCITKAIGDYK